MNNTDTAVRTERIREIFSDKTDDRAKFVLLAGLISADSNITDGDRRENIKTLRIIRDALENESGAEKFRDYCKEGIEILEGELNADNS